MKQKRKGQEDKASQQQIGHGDHALKNFKGIHELDEEEKYVDPVTGAHFEFWDFCIRLKQFNVASDKEKYKRSDNNEYYSFDSNTMVTDSGIFEGSVIVTTPK